MGDNTGIEWADATWNPATGCTHVSAGCDHCYAERLAERLQHMGVAGYENGFTYTEHPERLFMPTRWKRPRRIFVNSMSDLFHEHATYDFVRDVFATMYNTDQHTYQVLTKRPQKAASWIRRMLGDIHAVRLPAHIWIGTSVENEAATFRIPALLTIPARVRFLSCEPLLGPLDLTPYVFENTAKDDPYYWTPDGHGVDWVITGAESGPGARPMDEDWVRGIRDACMGWGVPLFYKQAATSGGKKIPTPMLDGRQWTAMPPVATWSELTEGATDEALKEVFGA